MTKEITDSNYQEYLNDPKLIVLRYTAQWCSPCRAIAPIFDKLSEKYSDNVIMGKVDVDENPNLSIEYGITNIPAVLFIKNGKVLEKLVGANTNSTYVKKIESYL